MELFFSYYINLPNLFELILDLWICLIERHALFLASFTYLKHFNIFHGIYERTNL